MFDGLLLFRPLSPILSESDMTEPDTMTYIRAGSCVRTCSSIRIYVWPDATVCVARCVRTHFTNRGMCQNVDNAVVSFVGAGFACPKTQSKLFSGEQTSPLLLLDNRCQRMPVSFYLFQECLGRAKVQIKVQTHG